MPCQYYETSEEIAQRREEAEARRQAELDRLTSEADKLREIIIEAVLNNKPPKVDAKFQREIYNRQVEHRKMDLARLEERFITEKDAGRLIKVWNADPAEPLERQLGFDPDDF